MADTITATDNLYIGFENSEGKIKYPVVIPNPKNEIYASDIKETAQNLITNRIILDSTTESDTFVDVSTAYTERKVVTKLEI